ncbi:hypothetical protein Pmar_PMAR001821 [Perkinsus marinus ATCC 50983]|uniref:Uncharacterized protein n=1 Tax=Perkinsus marinus (strain ATCC 50983 / TXsc) TaxID=423536 RepID=C5LJR0_PERM5|nr:hypothetical protein Pmar_PMAR001821 [Perkinsus marinus ATCC 50983]EER03077.1 hypothetical protein Pmar_PMAR001821 [Perkinsus marinus ATCC 50983]|eukprot:XP_002771261.1 hypothetical protein Pmar_PMAR001821 [Perkinsus marinus ATCC 50983]
MANESKIASGFNAARGFWQSPNKYFGSAENSMLPNAGANARASTARAELNAILTEACFSMQHPPAALSVGQHIRGGNGGCILPSMDNNPSCYASGKAHTSNSVFPGAGDESFSSLSRPSSNTSSNPIGLSFTADQRRNDPVYIAGSALGGSTLHVERNSRGARRKDYDAPTGVWRNPYGFVSTIYVEKRRVYGPLRKTVEAASRDREALLNVKYSITSVEDMKAFVRDMLKPNMHGGVTLYPGGVDTNLPRNNACLRRNRGRKSMSEKAPILSRNQCMSSHQSYNANDELINI